MQLKIGVTSDCRVHEVTSMRLSASDVCIPQKISCYIEHILASYHIITTNTSTVHARDEPPTGPSYSPASASTDVTTLKSDIAWVRLTAPATYRPHKTSFAENYLNLISIDTLKEFALRRHHRRYHVTTVANLRHIFNHKCFANIINYN